ncbi:hypothetical protein CBS101457_005628 [Exobasidium rhododendri]|nr:hypothetical protein CBS101457_005628 [Exobasidium rhododendri]
MQSFLATAFLLFALVASAVACPDHDEHESTHLSRRDTQRSSGGLIRPLQWGDVQILHTTDIHGWYQGHMKSSEPEPDYSGDWGDFASFVTHMRRQARKRGVDLLIVDSGDLHDGAGLSDGYPASEGPDAHVSNQFHSMVKYDVLSVGNHELYVYENALDTFKNFVPEQHGRYLASNVNITHTTTDGKNVTEPMGERYAKFTTENGRNVTSFGVLYNFQGQDKGLTVQPPAEMIKEEWFIEAIQEKPDFFLLVGHMPVRNDDWPVVVNAIRAVHPTVPLVIAGGHTHIRDCYIYDDNAFGIESGRYLETIGWLAFNSTDDNIANSSTPFSRSYIDANRRNYAFHAGLSGPGKLATGRGKSITRRMDKVAKAWNLTTPFGTSPEDYYLSRVPASSNSSLLHLLTQSILPTVISTSNPSRSSIPNIVLANSGSQRFDVYKGPFTKNDQYIVSPFKDSFLFLQDVPYQYASEILDGLNGTPTSMRKRQLLREDDDLVQSIYTASARESAGQVVYDTASAANIASTANATLGYVTKDSCPGLGDDTEHLVIPYYDQPEYVVSPLTNNVTSVGPNDLIDVVFLDFTLSDVVRVLNAAQNQRTYQVSDATPYNSLTTQDLYKVYAMQSWN